MSKYYVVMFAVN